MEIQRSTGYDPKADIRGSQKGQFEADLAFGEVGENHATSIVQALLDGWVEVKTDGYENGNLFIEVAQCVNKQGSNPEEYAWKKSGLNVTEAKYYMYLKQSETGELRSAIVIETERLRRFHRWVKETKGKQIQAPGFKGTGYLYGNLYGEIPTIGLRIASADLGLLQYGKQFD